MLICNFASQFSILKIILISYQTAENDETLFFYVFQDLQEGLDLGLVSPEVLQNFFDLDQYPLLKELAQRFQVYLFFEVQYYAL